MTKKQRFELGKSLRAKGIKYCRHCFIQDVPLIVESRHKTTNLYSCRECTRIKMKKYYSTPGGHEKLNKAIYNSIKRNSDHQNARAKVFRAVKKGLIKKPSVCSECSKKTRIEAHHEDYKKALEVMWLCKSCHCNKHKK